MFVLFFFSSSLSIFLFFLLFTFIIDYFLWKRVIRNKFGIPLIFKEKCVCIHFIQCFRLWSDSLIATKKLKCHFKMKTLSTGYSLNWAFNTFNAMNRAWIVEFFFQLTIVNDLILLFSHFIIANLFGTKNIFKWNKLRSRFQKK